MEFFSQFLSFSFPNIVLLIVLALTLGFLATFSLKYEKASAGLALTVKQLKQSNVEKIAVGVDPEKLNKFFLKNPIRHIWREYSDTLHPMRVGINDQDPVFEYRASMPAEAMFTKEAIVEGPMFDDFWRHLPGILTGLGIIGTFAGLLKGLAGFNVDPSKPEQAILGLTPLLDGVTHAFWVSATAIACAMIVVFVSRLLIAKLNSQVEDLCECIDGLYKSGAGEEYLQRLVQSSEKSEVHAAQLKNALVDDLTKLLTNLTERQIEAQTNAGRLIGESVGKSIADAITEPMQRVREVMEANAQGNTSQVTNMLETMLTGFMAKLEDTFGGQMRGMNEQMQTSMQAMSAVQSSLEALVQDIQKANDNATTQMTGKLEDAMQRASDNQQQLTQQMSQFVQDFRALVTDEQKKSKDAMNDTVANLLAEVSKSITSMENSRRNASQEDTERTRALTEQTGQIVTGLSTNVEELLKTVSDQVVKTQESINSVKDVSLRAIDGMNQGALNMGTAAQRFETAGGSVTKAFSDSTVFIEQVKASSAALQTASLAVNNGFEKYDSTRKSVDSSVMALTGLIESAKREAGVSKQLIESIEASVKALRSAEADSRSNLLSINDELVKAFKTFGDSLVTQVQRAIGETDTHVSKGTQHLTAVVQELGQAIHKMRKV